MTNRIVYALTLMLSFLFFYSTYEVYVNYKEKKDFYSDRFSKGAMIEEGASVDLAFDILGTPDKEQYVLIGNQPGFTMYFYDLDAYGSNRLSIKVTDKDPERINKIYGIE